jgi:hypothetical protein
MILSNGERARINIMGTRTGRLRAKVTPELSPAFEVTLGGVKWSELDLALRQVIGERARLYVNTLRVQLETL